MRVSQDPLIAAADADESIWADGTGSIVVGRVAGFTYSRGTGNLKTMILKTDSGDEVTLRMRSCYLQSLADNFSLMEGDRIGLKYLGQNPDTLNHVVRILIDEEEFEDDTDDPLGDGLDERFSEELVADDEDEDDWIESYDE